MPIFFTPLYLIAAMVALMPVVLHLLHRRRPRVVPFSTLRFLQQAMARTRRSRRLRNILILLLRTAILLLLVLAFARPAWQYGEQVGVQRRTLLLILDAGATMRVEEDESLFERARQWALALVDSLEAGDRLAVVGAGLDSPFLVYPPVSDRERARNILLDMQPGYGAGSIALSVRDALRRWRAEQADSGLEIHVFSDFRAEHWSRRKQEALSDQLDDRTILFLNRVRPRMVANAGVIAARFEPPVVVGERRWLRVSPLIRAGRDFNGSLSAQLWLAGEEVHSSTLALTPGQDHKADLLARPGLADGSGISGRVEISGRDMFAEDNVFFFSLPKVEEVKVLLIADNADSAADGALFLRKAIAPSGDRHALYSVRMISGRDFAAGEGIDDADIIFLSGYSRLHEAARSRLVRQVGTGTVLAVFPAGDDAGADFFHRFGDWSQLRVSLRESDGMELAPVLAGQDERAHPLQQRIERALPFAVQVPLLRRLHFAGLPERSSRVMSYADGSPFLWTAPVGRGRLWVGSLGAGRAWSDWPLSPLFVVVVQNILRESAGRLEPSLMTEVGGALDLPWPGDGLRKDAELVSPDGERQPISLDRRGQGQPFSIEGFSQPGLYGLHIGGRELTVAVNLPSSELTLDYPTPPELVQGIGGIRVEQAADWQELRSRLVLLKSGIPLWPWLLAAALILTVFEELLANGLSRGRRGVANELIHK